MRCSEQRTSIATDIVLRAHSQKIWNLSLTNDEENFKEITQKICEWMVPELSDSIQHAVSYMHKVFMIWKYSRNRDR